MLSPGEKKGLKMGVGGVVGETARPVGSIA